MRVLKTSVLLLLCILAWTVCLPGQSASRYTPNISGGLGVGLMYGGLGANLEVPITPQLVPTIGIGLNGDGGYLVGGRIYFRPDQPTTDAVGRITLGFAHCYHPYLTLKDHHHADRPVAGIGWSWANARGSALHGFEIDATIDGTISVGYRF